MAQTLKSGDKVKIIAGDNKGKSGKILNLNKKTNKAIIEGINSVERHFARTTYQPGHKKDMQLGIDLSNLKKEDK